MRAAAGRAGGTLARRALLGGLTIAVGCVTMPGPTPERLAGCYYFERDAAAEALRLPWGVRLTTDSLEGWPAMERVPEARRALTLIGYEEVARHPFGYWRPVGQDSLEVGYPAGGGLLLEVAVRPARLEGSVRPVGDVLAPPAAVPEPERYPTALIHALCPDEAR